MSRPESALWVERISRAYPARVVDPPSSRKIRKGRGVILPLGLVQQSGVDRSSCGRPNRALLPFKSLSAGANVDD
jgi:hypothetical protein